MEDKQEYYESREDMNQGIKDANTVNLDNPEQKEIIRKCNENIEYLRTSDLPKDETLKRIDNIIEGYEFDLIESQRSKTETYIIDGKRYERKLFNEKLLILIISRYEAFKKRIERMPDEIKQPENPYPEMFNDYKSYCLFNDFVNGADTKYYLREYSFIYRVMCEIENPALIHSHIKPGAFRTWFNEKYPELKSLSEVKTYNDAKIGGREKIYKQLKDKHFKTHSHTK